MTFEEDFPSLKGRVLYDFRVSKSPKKGYGVWAAVGPVLIQPDIFSTREIQTNRIGIDIDDTLVKTSTVEKHCLDKQRVRHTINEFISRIDKKVILHTNMKRCYLCGKDFNDMNNRDKLFSKTVLTELLKELGL